MTDTEKAWMAGIIDGEGHINIVMNRPLPTNTNKRISHKLMVRVTMGHLPTIKKLRELTGYGWISFNKPQKEKHNGAYTWGIATNQVYLVLKELFPYLVTKKAEAAIAMEFQEMPRNRTGRRGITPEILNAREDCRLRLIAARTRYHVGRTNLLLEPID